MKTQPCRYYWDDICYLYGDRCRPFTFSKKREKHGKCKCGGIGLEILLKKSE